MIEMLLVLPLILFVLSLVLYFGYAMERYQRATMLDRYEAWRSSARAPGPAVRLSNRRNTAALAQTFFRGDTPDNLVAEATEFFPSEPSNTWQNGAGLLLPGAQRLAERYTAELPRGRSLRFYTRHVSTVPLWESLVGGSIVHRHTVMDTDWRFVNQVLDGDRWYDDRDGNWYQLRDRNGNPSRSIPTMAPGDAVREAFYADFDRRLGGYASGNALAERIQDFYLLYPTYAGPEIELVWEPGLGWY